MAMGKRDTEVQRRHRLVATQGSAVGIHKRAAHLLAMPLQFVEFRRSPNDCAFQ